MPPKRNNTSDNPAPKRPRGPKKSNALATVNQAPSGAVRLQCLDSFSILASDSNQNLTPVSVLQSGLTVAQIRSFVLGLRDDVRDGCVGLALVGGGKEFAQRAGIKIGGMSSSSRSLYTVQN